MKHLGVLQRAGLLVVTRDGRQRWNSLNPVPLRDVLRRWVDHRQERWADVLLNVRDAAESEAELNESINAPEPPKGASS
jgi:hypothetical protein